MMKHFLTFIIAFLPFISSAQSTKLLEIDASSFAPVQTGIIDGVPIDKIGMDPSRRPCARIKMHVNRMSKEEINGLSVRTVGGSVVVTKCVVASEGNGLIIELTAKAPTRFYLHHEKYGDSNEVSLNLEGNKEYRIEASLNTTYSIVVLSNVSEAEVYLDGEYKGVTDKGNSLTVKDVYPGKHSIKVVRGSFTETLPVEVNSDNVFFRLNLETGQLKRHVVTFKIAPSGAQLKIDGEVYAENISKDFPAPLLEGEHLYSVSAGLYHEEKGTIVVNAPDLVKEIKLKPAYGWLQVSGKGDLNEASVYIDGKFIGKAPIKTGKLSSGEHVIRIEQNQYKPLEQKIIISDLQTLDFTPVLDPSLGKLNVTSRPEGADVYVDNQFVGKTPLFLDFIVGTHEVSIRKDRFLAEKKIIDIKENEVTTIAASLSDGVGLSSAGSANCYIISNAGTYHLPTVKGNSSQSVGAVADVAVLWESFGTNIKPKDGDLVSNISYSNGVITFLTNTTFKEGNAVIAAKDKEGKILWSWHIWFTDQPQGQEYYNNAGIMMDRNLGATSATPGDVGALGLLYQWGRKDPFLGSSSISDEIEARSNITWPTAVYSTSSTGNIAYAIAHPTTFINCNTRNYDWYYTGTSSTDNTRWTSSEKTKSIYDPCPAGWRVPDGGDNGVWAKALGSRSSFKRKSLYSKKNKGINFSGKFGESSIIWYPASGFRYKDIAKLGYVDYGGYYWAASSSSKGADDMSFKYDGYVQPSFYCSCAWGNAVRCVKE